MRMKETPRVCDALEMRILQFRMPETRMILETFPSVHETES